MGGAACFARRSRATLALLAVLGCGGADDEIVPTQGPDGVRVVLADFDAPGGDGRRAARWHVYRDDPTSAVAARLLPAAGPEAVDGSAPDASRASERALRLSFAFRSPRAREVGLRIPLRGLDASAYDTLALRIRGDAEAGFGPALRVHVTRPHRPGLGEAERGSALVEGVTPHWQEVELPLRTLVGLRDWTHLAELVVSVQARRVGRDRGAYWIDEVELRRTGRPGPSAHDPVRPPGKRAWEAARGGERAARSFVRARLAGWPEVGLHPEPLPADDRALLLRVARDTWRGLDALVDAEHGLPVDHVRFDPVGFDARLARVGDYTSPTSIGLHLLAVIAAHDLDWISRNGARARLVRALDSLEALESWRGFLFNFYDTTTLEPTSAFVSSVDCGWLAAGLLVLRQAFPELEGRATALVERGDFSVFYDPVDELLVHGHHVNVGVPSEYAYGTLFTEARIASLLAIGKGDVPESHWFAMRRSFPTLSPWPSVERRGRRSKRVAGFEVMGGWHEWRGVAFVPSWGGSMFEALMPRLVLDEARLAPESLGRNGAAHLAVQRRYARELLALDVFGLSPSATPGSDAYGEFGVPVLGVADYEPGVVAPYASALAVDLAPRAVADNLRRLAARHPVYGAFGFYDAVDPRSGEVARVYLTLDQAMTFLALANHLGSGALREWFASDPIVARVLPLLAHERFFD